ncbi:MAG: sugar phosphate nucleotidyltransferase [Candidatus Saccharimonadales bacterium]
MTTPITKAIIPVAGWGTRRLPITKAIEKCMLPVGNRPVVDYVVRDCIKAGITEIFFVVNKGSTQLQQYYSDNARLNEYLEYNGKQDLIELARPPKNVVFHYIEQDSNGKYGTAIPVSLVYSHLKKGESVLYAMGDAFSHTADGSSEFARLIENTPDGGVSLMSAPVSMEEVSRYGIIDFDEDTGVFRGIVDYPMPEQAPSNQINCANYVLNYGVMTNAYNYCQLDVSGEYYLTMVVSQYSVDGGTVNVVPIQGEYLDCGNVHGWLHANQLIVNR